MKRKYNLDLLRVFLCLCVITVHCFWYFNIENIYISTPLKTFLIQANGVFYILSGYFNLSKEFNDINDIKKYYKNKIITIIVPFISFVLVWQLWDYIHLSETFNILDFLLSFYKSIISENSSTYMWFLYPLFGMLLSTPFISKMLHSLDDKQLKCLWYISVAINFISVYLCANFNIGFGLSSWFFDGWFIYYFAGYYYKRIIANENKTKWLLLGLFGYIFTVVGLLFFKTFKNATDFSIMFTLFCLAIFVIFDNYIKVENKTISKILAYMSSNTFLIYLYHMRAIEFVAKRVAFINVPIIKNILLVILTFVVSLLASIITNVCLKPIQNLLNKKWVIK